MPVRARIWSVYHTSNRRRISARSPFLQLRGCPSCQGRCAPLAWWPKGRAIPNRFAVHGGTGFVEIGRIGPARKKRTARQSDAPGLPATIAGSPERWNLWRCPRVPRSITLSGCALSGCAKLKAGAGLSACCGTRREGDVADFAGPPCGAS
jgi:hypothetical protein